MSQANAEEARVRSSWGRIAGFLGVPLAFLVPFHPWQVGLLEEWGIQLSWQQEELSGYFARVPATLGRPLHLLPAYLGLEFSQGQMWGIGLAAALVAVAQYIGAYWAFRPLISLSGARWIIALAIAIHPWWPAGNLYRFLPAQVSVLGVVLGIGFALRWLGEGRVTWLVLAFISPLVGLLHYEALALAWCLIVVLLAVVAEASLRRRVALLLSAMAAPALVMLWSAVIAPKVRPHSYGSEIVSSGGGLSQLDVLGSLHSIASTFKHDAPALLALYGFAILLLGAATALRATDLRTAAVLAAGVAVSPLAAFSYALQAAHLNDPERVAFPTGTVVWLVAAIVFIRLAPRRKTSYAALATAFALVVTGGVANYLMWEGFSSDQERLLAGLTPIREQVPTDSVLILADTTGHYGDVYTLLPPYVELAVTARDGYGASVVLCTPDGVAREHPVAARFPLVTTPDCSAVPEWSSAARVGTIATDYGDVQVWQAPKPTASPAS